MRRLVSLALFLITVPLDDRTVYATQELSWRVDKLVLESTSTR